MKTYKEIRESYIQFLKENGHKEIPNVSLVMEDDPTLLFVNAGMVPLVPFLKGEKHPLGKRLTNVQRSVRTIDIDEVGDATHCTAFEMLGNWSLNDYFKKEALDITFRFLVEILDISPEKIRASVFKGNDVAPLDKESIEVLKGIYSQYGIDAKVGRGEVIETLGKDNWWGLDAGGPCGPTCEFFVDTGKASCGDKCGIECDCGRFMEITNNVFMEYLKEENDIKPLGRHNVDFGGGLERIVAMMQGVKSFYETDIYKPIYDFVESQVNDLSRSEDDKVKSLRIIVDHIKAATWIVMDGVEPDNTEQGYVLRRLIRRSIRHGFLLGIENEFITKVAEIAIDQFKDIYPKLQSDRSKILEVLREEEDKFKKTLKRGVKEVESLINDYKTKNPDMSIPFENEGGKTFTIYETYGFPLEMTIEELESHGVPLNVEKVKLNHEKAFKQHQEKSRSATKGRFKGGLADTSEDSTKLHTATHLLLAALRKVLGDHVFQKGSNITTERLRFDFPHDDKLTDQEVKEIENDVNTAIKAAFEVNFTEMPKEKALKEVDTAMFEQNYPDIVKVYTVGDPDKPYSKELCRGPHVDNTNELGHFKIIKQENIGSGLRRIKAVLE